MDFAGEEDIFKLSPLSWEGEATKPEESKTQSIISSGASGCPILSQHRRHFSTSSTPSSDGFVFRNNAGATPKKTSKIKNSIDAFRDKSRQFKIECKKAARINLSRGNPVLLDVETPDLILLPDDRNTQYSLITPLSGEETNNGLLSEEKRTQYSSITETSGNETPSISISQLDLKSNCDSSLKTIDEIDDSDIDMFEDFDLLAVKSASLSEIGMQSLEIDNFSKNLANYSCPYFNGKFNFAPEGEFSRTNYLEKELFETSTKEIKEKIVEILTFLEM